MAHAEQLCEEISIGLVMDTGFKLVNKYGDVLELTCTCVYAWVSQRSKSLYGRICSPRYDRTSESSIEYYCKSQVSIQ